MRDQTLLFWGMVVTMFLLIAAMLTARELFEMYMEKRQQQNSTASGEKPAGPGAGGR